MNEPDGYVIKHVQRAEFVSCSLLLVDQEGRVRVCFTADPVYAAKFVGFRAAYAFFSLYYDQLVQFEIAPEEKNTSVLQPAADTPCTNPDLDWLTNAR